MRKFVISAAVAVATLAAVPAAAQYRDHDRRDDRGSWNQRGPDRQAVNQLLRDLDRVDQQIQRLQQRRQISNREALSLRREANQIRNQIHRASRSRNGLSGREFGQLRAQVNRLEQRVRHEARDRDGRRW